MTTPTIFALGSNSSGQLGLAHTDDVSVPKPSTFHPLSPSYSTITQITAGGNHTVLLTSDGEVWVSGDPASYSGATTTATTTTAISDSSHEEAVTGAPPAPAHVFLKLNLPPGAGKAVHISATWTTTIIVCDPTTTSSPPPIEPPTHSQQIVYTFGMGDKGELGRPSGPPTATTTEPLREENPYQIPNFPPPNTTITSLSSSLNHTVAVLSNNTPWGWGSSRKNQLGPSTAPITASPSLIPIPFPVHRTACGQNFTALFSSPSTSLIHIQGTPKCDLKSQVPDHIAPNWLDVSAGWSNLYVLTAEGEVLSWGCDTQGQLVPPGLPRVKRMAVGSEHVVALTKDGEVVSWGWGEHGNCGPIDVAEHGAEASGGDGSRSGVGVVKGRWNVLASSKYIKDGSRIVGLGAGCATSWVVIETEGLVL